MASKWGIPILSEDGSHYGIIIPAVVYKDFPSWSSGGGVSALNENEFLNAVKSTGTDLRQFFREPLSSESGTNEYYYSIINNNHLLKFKTSRNNSNYYYVQMYVCDSNKVEKAQIGGTLSIVYPDVSDSTYQDLRMHQSLQLAIYPYTNIDNTDDIDFIGNLRFASWAGVQYGNSLGDMWRPNIYPSGYQTFNELFGVGSVVPTYPSGGVDPEDNWGGDEHNFDTDSDDIEMPTVVASAINNGYIQTYVITATQMSELMSEVLDFTNTTVTDFWSNVSKVFGDPISAIISLKQFCVPTEDIPTWGATNVKLLNFTSEVYCPVVNVQYAIIDVGSITVNEFFGGFLDYPPYTRCTIYLPFIGEKELNVQEVMDATLHLYYMVDYLTGNCVAHLIVTKSAGETNLNSDLYQWQGNLATDIPISGNNDANTLGNMLSSAISGLTAGMSMSIGGEISSIGNELNYAGSGSKVLAGSIGGGYSLMGVRVPYIKIENPIQTMPENFQELRGLAGNINHTIGDLSGFLRCREVDINNITATDDEKAELYALLTGGIFV